MKTVTICGSMRFEKEMIAISFLLETKYNLCVLQCVYNTEQHDISEHELERLARAHYKKIELSDAVYVIDIDGYIGRQAAKEIEYARALDKEVIYNSTFMNNTDHGLLR